VNIKTKKWEENLKNPKRIKETQGSDFLSAVLCEMEAQKGGISKKKYVPSGREVVFF